jgi:hypothetical protein
MKQDLRVKYNKMKQGVNVSKSWESMGCSRDLSGPWWLNELGSWIT